METPPVGPGPHGVKHSVPGPKDGVVDDLNKLKEDVERAGANKFNRLPSDSL